MNDGHAHDDAVAELTARGLYDPGAANAAGRLALLEYLLELGATVDDIEAAGEEMAAVATTVTLRGAGERFCRAEAAARAGIPEELAIRLFRTAGLPDPGPDALAYSAEDVAALQAFMAATELLGPDAAFQLVRVIGSALARIADAEVSAFLTNVGGPLITSDPSGLELARANAAAAALLREAGGAIDTLLRRHVDVAQRPLMPGTQETTQVAVGFADLVGSTALGEELTFAALGRVLTEFEQVAVDTIVDGGGRMVKFIGDEVMFIASDPGAACSIALALAAQFSHHACVPPVHVGIAFGDVLTRDGDYFGPVVNLAVRIAQRAERGEVLTSASVQSALVEAAAFRFTALGTTVLHGIREPVELFRLERA